LRSYVDEYACQGVIPLVEDVNVDGSDEHMAEDLRRFKGMLIYSVYVYIPANKIRLFDLRLVLCKPPENIITKQSDVYRSHDVRNGTVCTVQILTFTVYPNAENRSWECLAHILGGH
ncbi:hypothetical protein PENTCL1PPCAC_19549, partial [Pristionchus entomophagus]